MFDRYKTKNAINDNRFKQLFGLCESLLLLTDNEPSRKALAVLYSQAWPFMHQRQAPTDVEGTCALYLKALTYDTSPQMQAQVANRQFFTSFAAGKNNEAVAFIKNAIMLSQPLEDKEEHQLLIANIHHNYAEYLMTPKSLDLEQAETNMRIVENIMRRFRAQGSESLIFAVYDMRSAYLNLLKGKSALCKEALERAITTLKKQPESCQMLLEKAQTLLRLLNKGLKTGSAKEMLAEFKRERLSL